MTKKDMRNKYEVGLDTIMNFDTNFQSPIT
jgi:hypothetical protein